MGGLRSIFPYSLSGSGDSGSGDDEERDESRGRRLNRETFYGVLNKPTSTWMTHNDPNINMDHPTGLLRMFNQPPSVCFYFLYMDGTTTSKTAQSIELDVDGRRSRQQPRTGNGHLLRWLSHICFPLFCVGVITKRWSCIACVTPQATATELDLDESVCVPLSKSRNTWAEPTGKGQSIFQFYLLYRWVRGETRKGIAVYNETCRKLRRLDVDALTHWSRRQLWNLLFRYSGLDPSSASICSALRELLCRIGRVRTPLVLGALLYCILRSLR
jgi:hypothetical protein